MASFTYHFNWEPAKADTNFRKHGVRFEATTAAVMDPLALSLFDADHSESEERWVTLGQGGDRALLVVVHTFDELNSEEAVVRIVSARWATNTERRMYEGR